MSGAMSEGAGRELRDALVVWSDERAPYNLIIVIICVECGAEECGATSKSCITSNFRGRLHATAWCGS